MFFKNSVKINCLIFILATIGFGFAETYGQPELDFIGTSKDGKSYYANQVERDWLSSQKYCESLKMTLASFESETQFELLRSFDKTKQKGHWTDGIQTVDLRDFTWNSTGAKINTNLPYRNYFKYQPKYCLCIINNDEAIYMYSRLCESTRPVICETKI